MVGLLEDQTLPQLEKVDSATELNDTATLTSKRNKDNNEIMSDDNRKGEQQQQQQPSRLLSLPAELQLLIWSFVVVPHHSTPQPILQIPQLLRLPTQIHSRIEELAHVPRPTIHGGQDTPTRTIVLNCPCDSSYGGWTTEYYADRKKWADGIMAPPKQPALTAVCRSIREDALKMFYSANRFQVGYCYECDLSIVIGWLRNIGPRNRGLLKNLYFFDANGRHDRNCPRDLIKLKRSMVMRELGGKIVTSEYEDGVCRHWVRFETGEERDEVMLEGFEGLFLVEKEA